MPIRHVVLHMCLIALGTPRHSHAKNWAVWGICRQSLARAMGQAHREELNGHGRPMNSSNTRHDQAINHRHRPFDLKNLLPFREVERHLWIPARTRSLQEVFENLARQPNTVEKVDLNAILFVDTFGQSFFVVPETGIDVIAVTKMILNRNHPAHIEREVEETTPLFAVRSLRLNFDLHFDSESRLSKVQLWNHKGSDPLNSMNEHDLNRHNMPTFVPAEMGPTNTLAALANFVHHFDDARTNERGLEASRTDSQGDAFGDGSHDRFVSTTVYASAEAPEEASPPTPLRSGGFRSLR